MFEFATDLDTNEIRTLWDVAFGDEVQFNNWFFANKYKPQYCLVLRENGIIKAMAQLLPYEISSFGRVSYIYGAVTHPDYRGQGLMSRLLEYSFDYDKKRGYEASILIPQNKPLFDFYKRLGYKTCFYVKTEIGKPDVDVSGYSLINADCEDIVFMNGLYSQFSAVVRDKQYWLEQIRLFNELGGSVYILIKQNKPVGYGFVTDGFVQEGFGEVERLAKLAGVSKYVTGGGDVPAGMAHCYNKELPNMYFNLAFN